MASGSSSNVSSPNSSDIDPQSNESKSSSDSESTDSATSTNQQRPRLRRRWRNCHLQSNSTNAVLPRAKPASTSLWTTREKQFEKFRSSLLSMPVPDGVGRIKKAKGFSLHIMSALIWVLPDSLLQSSAIPATSDPNESDNESEEPLLTLGVHVSLFHAESKRFFGNTWVSPELAVDPFAIKQIRETKDGTLRYVIENVSLNFRAYFISDIVDTNCIGVLEFVAYEKDPDSKATIQVAGCGWTILPLFSRQQTPQEGILNGSASLPSAFSLTTSGDSANVFMGSPRLLWELNSDAWSSQDKYDGSKLYYQLSQYDPMLNVATFVRKNELVSALDPIPGLKNGNLANLDVGNKPETLLQDDEDVSYEDTLASFVRLSSLVPKSIQVEEPFELSVAATRVVVNMRDEIEANLVARLRISRKAIYEGAMSVVGEVSARVLKFALHNGRCFRTRQFTVPLKAHPNGGDTLMCVRNQSRLRGFVFHPNMAIVVVLQFTVHFRIIWPVKLKQQALEANKPPLPEEDVVLVTMGARALVPSDGKKLYLYDKYHLATAASAEPLTVLDGVPLQAQAEQRQVLHVDLLSGAPCRPYSDNTLYTPPDQLTRSLYSREVSLKDSFAFCDLMLTLDEDITVTEKPSEHLITPSPPCEEEKEKIEDCAADLWAKKLLNKANDNPLLAQTLNALATSPLKEKISAAKPPSPSKKHSTQLAVSTTQIPDVPITELSRASKTLLSRYGYMESHDKPLDSPPNNQTAHDESKGRQNSDRMAKSIETEVNDLFKANEIRFHFAAFKANSRETQKNVYNPAPSRVYFTFQFYHFPPTRSETLRLSKAFDNGACKDIQTFLLMRDKMVNKPALAIQFDVDTTASMNPLETRHFAEYLKWHNLYVDVWDADSLFQLGTIIIPLHELLRQGTKVKKFQAEVEILPPLEATTRCRDVFTFPDTTNRADKFEIGRIQLLMSCYGVKGEHLIDQQATYADQDTTVQTHNPQPQKAKNCVCARPLVETNAELHRRLSENGFYNENTENVQTLQRRSRPMCLKKSTLTPKEIDILCNLFGSRNAERNSTTSHSTRIKCDFKNKTGLLALLSMRPPDIKSNRANEAAISVNKHHTAVQVEKTTNVDDCSNENRLNYIVNLAAQHQSALAHAFAGMDINHDEYLTPDEFFRAIQSLGSALGDLSEKDVKLLFDLLDSNQDGKIAYRELKQFVKEPIYLSRTKWHDQIKTILERAKDRGISVYDVFAELDVLKDGKLSFDAFDRGLKQLDDSSRINSEIVQSFLMESKQHHEGTISYIEFLESFGISSDANKEELANETFKEMTESIRGIVNRLDKQGIEFREAFAHFDTDRNGTLSIDEFSKALSRLIQIDGSTKDTLKATEQDLLTKFMKTVKTDGDGKINYHEFLTAYGVTAMDTQHETAQSTQAARLEAERKLIKLIGRAMDRGMTLKQVFDQLDAIPDGGISVFDFQQNLEKLLLAQEMSLDDAQLITDRFNVIEDGIFSREEFQEFGAEISKKQQTLATYFAPHLEKLSSLSSKVANDCWTSVCQAEMNISLLEMETKVWPLMSYFDFVSEDGSVNAHELRKWCSSVECASLRKSTDSYAATERFKQLLLTAQSQGVDLQASFAHFNEDQDGKLTRFEFKRGLKVLESFQDMSEAEFDALWNGLDKDNSGTIDVEKFRTLLTELNSVAEHLHSDNETEPYLPPVIISYQQSTMEKLRKLLLHAEANGIELTNYFAHFDTNKNGVMTTQEFGKTIKQLPGFDDISDEEISTFAKILDKDDSGSVSREKFDAFLRDSTRSLIDGVEVYDEDPKFSIAASNDASESKDLELSACADEMGHPSDSINKDAVKTEQEHEEAFKSEQSLCQILEIRSEGNRNPLEEKVDISEDKSVFGGAERIGTSIPLTEQVILPRSLSEKSPDGPPPQTETKTDDTSQVNFKLTKEATKGLSQFKKLLQTAFQKEVTVQQSFSHFDKKADDFVSYNDFKTGLRELGSDFVNLSDNDILLMAKTLDSKQRNGLCVEDLMTFFEIPDTSEHFKNNAKSTIAENEATFTFNASEVPIQTPRNRFPDVETSKSSTDSSTIVQENTQRVDIPTVRATPRTEVSAADNLACNYPFHSDPEIRAVELKVRQIAVKAYQRGTLPLRVVTRFLEDADDHRGRIPGDNGREKSRQKRTELRRVEFLQVLMELGFTLLSDQDKEDDPHYEPKMNDHLYARQIERLARYRQQMKSNQDKEHKQLVRAITKTTKQHYYDNQEAEDSLRRFEDKKTKLLHILSYYREGQKKSLVHSLLRQQVTTSLTLFPSFGDLLFFELSLRNPYNHNDRFKVEILLPSSRDPAVILDLDIVRNSDEWTFYRENLPLAFGVMDSSAHIEDEMIDDQNEVVLEPNDHLQIPMRLRWLDMTDRIRKQGATVPISIVIKSCSLGQTVALFNIQLHPQPFTCHRVLRFSQPASSIWRWKLKYPRDKFIVCMDPSVAMEELRGGQEDLFNHGIMSFKCRVGDYPALETFFIVLYDDKYHARTYEVWQVQIQSKLRVDVHAIFGQSVQHELVIKSDEIPANQHVKCFTPMYHHKLIQFRPAQVFTLVPQALNRIEFNICAVECGGESQKVILVNLVDIETHELVGAWSIHVTLALPVITKTYELNLPLGRAVQKKISYLNPWDQPQTIRLRSSAPNLLIPRESEVRLPSNGQAFIRIAFAARDHLTAVSQAIYLFINDKRTDQNEECLLFQVTYV
ncbi:EF-hand domain pair [Plasmopara halstedii]|uniref:EF-hand domain pair n=1 Tax=Plasmopara halstedii TaxID=4781 RepID=A0A0N7L4W4_PLAHL|nr:EF-hand domain pair [Plasmopara halstedii]CEG39803.1 EF-hand domain pair [Plasmopara halstedii]|eukprot:XP_024576172.1 EF-hand domain pair [Plasmopara halstedii]